MCGFDRGTAAVRDLVGYNQCEGLLGGRNRLGRQPGSRDFFEKVNVMKQIFMVYGMVYVKGGVWYVKLTC